jgi:hypothetical protein
MLNSILAGRKTALLTISIGVTYSLFVSSPASAQACYSPAAPRALTAEQLKTVVITDQAVLNKPEFSFGNTLGAIIKSASDKVADSPAERITLLTSMIRSFRVTERTNSDSRLNLRIDPRPGEIALDPIKLLGTGPGSMKPIALFNRWDLAPNDFRNCGEHRIVFGREADPSDPQGGPKSRFLLIFEAAVDNPDPANDKKGCQGIVNFWKSLEGKPAPILATELQKFYFTGLDSNGDGKPDYQPVIHAQHYGAPYGQVRGNLFMHQSNFSANPWQLREWRVSLTSDGAPIFAVDTDKKNPHPKLYSAQSSGEIEGGFAALRRDFNTEFLKTYLSELTELDPKSPGTTAAGNDLIAKAGANFHGRFDSFTSVSQGQADNPETIAAPALRSAMTAGIKDRKVPDACGLTAEHILARAGTVSCGGCHQFSADRPVAPGVLWPKPVQKDGGFVQVHEDGTLSPALLDHFLPARRDILMLAFPVVAAAVTPAPAAATESTPTQTRDALTRVQGSENRLQAIDALRDFESSVQSVRRLESLKPGAFVPVRRVH